MKEKKFFAVKLGNMYVKNEYSNMSSVYIQPVPYIFIDKARALRVAEETGGNVVALVESK